MVLMAREMVYFMIDNIVVKTEYLIDLFNVQQYNLHKICAIMN